MFVRYFGSLPPFPGYFYKQQLYSSYVQYRRTSNKSYRIWGTREGAQHSCKMPLTPFLRLYIFRSSSCFQQPWLIVQYFSKYNASSFYLPLNSSLSSDVGLIKLYPMRALKELDPRKKTKNWKRAIITWACDWKPCGHQEHGRYLKTINYIVMLKKLLGTV